MLPNHIISILLVDDEPSILEYLAQYFLRRSFLVTTAANGEEGQHLAAAQKFDIIILDNVMPKKTGPQVCMYLRSTGISTPIIILSAQADTLSKIELLTIGADDYVTKPFRIEELTARVHALLRRSGALQRSAPLTSEDVVMDRNGHIVQRGGSQVYLTKKEFKILELLMERKGLLVPREALIKHVWGIHANTSLHTFDTHLANLRKKLCLNDRPDIIVTVPGIGYKVS